MTRSPSGRSAVAPTVYLHETLAAVFSPFVPLDTSASPNAFEISDVLTTVHGFGADGGGGGSRPRRAARRTATPIAASGTVNSLRTVRKPNQPAARLATPPFS